MANLYGDDEYNYDSDIPYQEDTNTYYSDNENMDPYPLDEYGNALPPIGQSDVKTNADGSITVTNQDGSKSTYPPGELRRDSSGNWIDKLGNYVISAAAGAAGTAASPYLDNLATGGYLKKTEDMLMNAGNNIRGTNVPNLLAVIPRLQQQVQQGIMTPAEYQAALIQIQGKMDAAQATAAQMQDSNMRNVSSDQQSLVGARNALGQLEDIAKNRGMTEADRAAFNAFMNRSNADASAQRAAQLQQLQMQGNAGTGAELAARLSGVQGSANANAQAGATMAQAAQARALQAIQAGLQGNTALNAQLFGQDTSKAQAQDAVNQFNAAAKNAINQANAQLAQQANLANFNTANQIAQANQQAANQAGQYNAGNRQASNLANFNMANTIAGKNTDIANQNLVMPYQATQSNFTNQLDRNKAAAAADVNAGSAMSKILESQITRGRDTGAAASTATGSPSPAPAPKSSGTSEVVGSVVKAAAPAVISWLGGLFSDEELKEDKQALSDKEVDRMLAELTAYKYRYKGGNNPEQAGVMAQDVEKGMPNSVVDTPAGKMIQKPEMMSNVLAIIANQHNRIKNLEGR